MAQDKPFQSVIVVCADIHPRFKEYLVRATHNEIVQVCSIYKKQTVENNKLSFLKVSRRLFQYDDDTLDRHYREKTQQWREWCDDVVLFYAVRYILLGRMMPITNDDDGIEVCSFLFLFLCPHPFSFNHAFFHLTALVEAARHCVGIVFVANTI